MIVMSRRPRDFFKDFLETASKKAPVKSEDSKLLWDYEEVEYPERTPRYLDSPFLEQVISEPVVLTARELSILKEHIEQLDMQVLRLRKRNRLLTILCLALFLFLVTVLVGSNVGGFGF
ncbi:hypothetical protein DRO58_08790 [Candidatus Bathyarchaeota archaeon]|nr:MAG: hypothetical protein DRO58_08790 [Candidatus Bathyarchaeota archaeon]